MSAFVCFLLLAASRVQLVDDVVRLPAGEWRYVEVNVKQQPVLVAADFDAPHSGKHMRLLLMRREDVERLRGDRGHGIMAATAPAGSGILRYTVRAPGDYAVVVDNRAGRNPAEAHLRVALDFAAHPGPEVGYVSPRRQIVIIALSFAFFFAVITWSARRIIRAIKS